jgi:BirA family biotin operon repressor/biotin-[acetyl-CoA-carboxylase] ligase
MTDPLDAPAVEGALRGRLGRPLRTFSSLGSTSTEAARWAAEGAPHGALVVADHQTAGRGRGARRWASRPGRSVHASLVLRPSLPLPRAGLLTTALGVAVAEAVAEIDRLDVRLKWPNDVTVRGRKVAGILVESRVARGALEVAIAGFGINVAWTCEELVSAVGDGATSIACELARAGGAPSLPSRATLLAATLRRAEGALSLLEGDEGPAELVRRAAARSDVLGRDVVVTRPDGSSFVGRAAALLPSGAIEVIVEGRRRAVDAGDIEHLRPA